MRHLFYPSLGYQSGKLVLGNICHENFLGVRKSISPGKLLEGDNKITGWNERTETREQVVEERLKEFNIVLCSVV